MGSPRQNFVDTYTPINNNVSIYNTDLGVKWSRSREAVKDRKIKKNKISSVLKAL